MMRALLSQFMLLLILFAISCQGTQGFRSLLGKIRQRRRVTPTSPTSLERPFHVSEQQQQQQQQKEEREMSDSSRDSEQQEQERRQRSFLLLKEFWQDFSFLNVSSQEDAADNGSSGEFNNVQYERDLDANVVHFCFLAHGLNGYSRDLSYLQSALLRTAQQVKDDAKHQQQQRHDMVVHASVCNERKTMDGVKAGGERLTEEIRSVIREEMAKREQDGKQPPPIITVSFLGNSLGGLYSRYAIAKLVESCEHGAAGHLLFDRKYQLHLNIFCTTATPHLGVSGHTYVPLPRFGEVAMAQAMGQTWRDIFRVNDLIRQMATLDHFVGPMKLFRQRIAYANAYGTDFPVPVHTAAFLHDESDYPHHFVENRMQQRIAEEHAHLCIATVHTPPQHSHHSEQNNSLEDQDQDRDCDELAIMSRSLDALGWRKVFVDPRRIVPKLKLSTLSPPKLNLSTRLNLYTTSDSYRESENASMTSESEPEDEQQQSVSSSSLSSSSVIAAQQDELLDRLKARGVVSSREMFRAVSASPFLQREHIMWPSGHNMIVALSRNSAYARMNKPGRPIVDALASELVQDIFAFSPQNDGTTAVTTSGTEGRKE